MGLFHKIFGEQKGAGASTAPASSQFAESGSPEPEAAGAGPSRNAPRRELVQVVLRDTMRRHGIPSDWIDCRVLPAVNRAKSSGMHVHLVVRDGHDRLLTYVPAFQASFLAELRNYEPKADDWLFSLSWEFRGIESMAHRPMPDPASWSAKAQAAPAAAAEADDDVMEDIKALLAIRDAALQDPARDAPDFEPTRPGFENSKSGPRR